MVTVKTSYYAKVARGVKASSKLVIVSNTHPSWFTGDYILMKELAPMWADIEEYTNKEISYNTFVERYYATLLSRFESVVAIRKHILEKVEVEDDEDIILLCWEKEGSRCHRKALAELVFEKQYEGEL